MSDCDSMDCNPPGSSVCGVLPGMNTGVGCHAFLLGLFPTGIKHRSLMSPVLAGRFFITSATCDCSKYMCRGRGSGVERVELYDLISVFKNSL